MMRAATRRIAVLSLFVFIGCTTVRQLKEPASLTPDGKAMRTRTEDALDYSVAIPITAPPTAVWSVLTDAKNYTAWNSTLIKLDGDIVLGGKIELVSKVAPDRTFNLKVSELVAPTKMVWEDGNGMFLGVRHFTLIPSDGGTILAMSETYSGLFLGSAEKKDA